MGSSSHTNIQINKNVNDVLIESWDYKGNIYLYNKSEKSKYSLSGKIFIKSRNEKRKIEIKDTSLYKEFFGEEKSRLTSDDKIITKFQMLNNNDIELNNIEIIKTKDGKWILKGNEIKIKANNKYINIEFNLFNHKKYNEELIISNSNPATSEVPAQSNQNKKSQNNILEKSLIGMKNLINTCYINSSFQILIHIPEFIEIIRKNDGFEKNIIEEINKIYNKILTKNNQFKPVVNPKSFVNYFKSKHSQYHNYSQMDSEMFLEELIWDINIELGNLGEKRDKKDSQINENFEKEKNLTEKEKELIKIKKKNFGNYLEESELETNFQINDLFYVYFVHEKKCQNCENITYYYDEIPGLKLNFNDIEYQYQYQQQYTINLNKLIRNNFQNPSIYKSNILCQKCQQSQIIIETSRIAKLPKILICSLQKANSENSQKIPWMVEFGPEITIREIADEHLIKDDNSCKYKLFAINNHLGSTPKSGHYFSQIFLEKRNAWYSFNDESVEINSGYSQNLNNYILFYRQKEK